MKFLRCWSEEAKNIYEVAYDSIVALEKSKATEDEHQFTYVMAHCFEERLITAGDIDTVKALLSK